MDLYELPVSPDGAHLHKETVRWDFNNPPEDSEAFAQRLLKTMRAFGGIGLAAPQVEQYYKVFVVHAEQPFAVFNPTITWFSDEVVDLDEGCLSFPALKVKVRRPKHIRVRFQSHTNETIVKRFTGMTARVFQHEYDHLEGITFFERANFLHKDRAKKKWKQIVRQMKKQAK